MTLTLRQKSNIRHFVYYLTNGTLNPELIQEVFGDDYHLALQAKPELFYKTACVYINQEIASTPKWPDTKRLGKFICQLYLDNIDSNDFDDWETNFATEKPDFSSDFKKFTRWFINAKTIPGISFKNYIGDGATFVEQCFAIWANVVILDENKVNNYDHAIARVEQYIKSYYIEDYVHDLEEWECELHFE